MSLNISAMSDLQAEAGVLATVIKHPDFLSNLTYIKPGMFFSTENGCMFWCVQKLYEEGITNIDALNMSNAINSNKAIKKKIEEYNLGNIQEFLELSRYAARDTLEEYKLLANQVVSLAYKRDMYKNAIDLQQMCVSDKSEVEEINEKLNSISDELSNKFIIGEETHTFGEKAKDVWKRIVDNRNPDGTVGFPSKIPSFNEYFSFCKKELVLLTARMKKGKSAYFMNEVIHLCINNGVPTLMLDTEMSDEQLMKRMIANLTGIEVKRVESGKYSEEEARKIDAALEKIEAAPLVHEYIPEGFNRTKIEALCHQWKNKLGIEFVVYDYFKSDDLNSSAYDNFQKLGVICDFFKNTIAGKMDIAVLAGAQLNRDNKVGSSDKIEMYCSTSIKWFEKDAETIQKDSISSGNYGASIVLNRNGGQTGEDDYIDILFRGDTMTITEAAPHKREDSPFTE